MAHLDHSQSLTPFQVREAAESDRKAIENGELPPVVIGIKCSY